MSFVSYFRQGSSEHLKEMIKQVSIRMLFIACWLNGMFGCLYRVPSILLNVIAVYIVDENVCKAVDGKWISNNARCFEKVRTLRWERLLGSGQESHVKHLIIIYLFDLLMNFPIIMLFYFGKLMTWY